MNVDAGFALPLVLPATVGAPAVTDIPVADFSTLLAAQSDPAIAASGPMPVTSGGSLTGRTEAVAMPPHPLARVPQSAANIAPPTDRLSTPATAIKSPTHPDRTATPDVVPAAPDAMADTPPPVELPSLLAVKGMPHRAPASVPAPKGALQRPDHLRPAPDIDAQEPSPPAPPPAPVVMPLAPALPADDVRAAPSRASVTAVAALPTALPVGPPAPVTSLTDAGNAVVIVPPETPLAIASAANEAPRPGTLAAAPAAQANQPQPQGVPAAIAAERRNRALIESGSDAPAPVAVSLGDMMPRLHPARDPAPPLATGRETAAPAPIMPELTAEAAIATDHFGDVRIAVEGTATDVKVSLALTPTAVLAAGDAQRLANGLAADLAATGVRLQSLDISGGDTGRGGNPQGQREPAPQRPQPTPFAPQRAPIPPRSDRYA